MADLWRSAKMNDAFYAVTLGLPVWWLAQTLLSIRDYLKRRREILRLPPPSEEEVRLLSRIQAMRPQKEKKSIRWYAEHPGDAMKRGWIFVPVVVFFWPMALLLFTLPPLEPRLSPEMIERARSELT